MTSSLSASMATLTYRTKIFVEDIDNVRAILESVAFFKDWEVDQAIELLYEHMADPRSSRYRFIFVESDNIPVAYACYGVTDANPEHFDIYWIAVLDDYRGQGIGKDLLAETERCIRKEGGKAIFLETSMRKSYYPTRLFYERNGYHQAFSHQPENAAGETIQVYSKLLGTKQTESTDVPS